MSELRTALEQQLLRDPFDAQARSRYAQLLLDAGEPGAAVEQWRVLLRAGESADRHLETARCCQALGDAEGALSHRESAARCADFDPHDARLAELGQPRHDARSGAAADARPGVLRVLQGGQPAEPRGGDVISISRVEKVRFADVVGMRELKQVLRLRIIEPFVRPGLFERFKKRSGGGVLLYGPPGCGKTLIARAIASECSASFTAVGISDILNLWVGESERNLAGIFEKAREEAPSVLFFDELDALAFARSKAHSDHTRTLVNEFLNQLDGFAGRGAQVLTLAASNMPWDIDEAMKRPGRFDRQIFVPPPDAEARTEMFRAKLRDVPHADVQFAELAARTEHFSGADVDGVIEYAKDCVLSEILESRGDPDSDSRALRHADLLAGVESAAPSTLEWLKTARNLVKYGGAGGVYRDVERYLRGARLY